MLEIVMLGLNHKTAPVELREKLAFTGDQVNTTLDALYGNGCIKEIMLISTCNRVEFLFTTDSGDNAVEYLKSYLSDTREIPRRDLDESLYVHRNGDAVNHIFRVASSLDSLVVGEPQILGQVKDAYQLAADRKTSGVILNRLMHKTFFTAKRVRSETGIGDNAVSISYAAIELAKKIFGELEGKKVLLVGAGEMAELAVEHLIRNRATDIFVANRTFKNGVALAERFRGTPLRMEELEDSFRYSDIIISSTGSSDYVIKKDMVKRAMKHRKNRSIFFIDIAVPRDIDPEINRLTNAYVYDIDDLKGVIDENIDERNREAVKGERLIDEAVIHFQEWIESLRVVPTIKSLQKKANSIMDTEMKKTLGSMQHLSDDDLGAIKRMAGSIASKIIHDPILFLKNPGVHRDESVYLSLTRTLFNIDE